jgi:hypothetical protein
MGADRLILLFRCLLRVFASNPVILIAPPFVLFEPSP